MLPVCATVLGAHHEYQNCLKRMMWRQTGLLQRSESEGQHLADAVAACAGAAGIEGAHGAESSRAVAPAQRLGTLQRAPSRRRREGQRPRLAVALSTPRHRHE